MEKTSQDKALKKALENREKGDLPYGFESEAMNRIMLEALRQRKRANVLMLCLISSVSLSLIAGTVLLLRFYFHVEVALPKFPGGPSPASYPVFGFYSYIAFLALILLGLDHWFRKMRHRTE